jgi:hypothetical protein
MALAIYGHVRQDSNPSPCHDSLSSEASEGRVLVASGKFVTFLREPCFNKPTTNWAYRQK